MAKPRHMRHPLQNVDEPTVKKTVRMPVRLVETLKAHGGQYGTDNFSAIVVHYLEFAAGAVVRLDRAQADDRAERMQQMDLLLTIAAVHAIMYDEEMSSPGFGKLLDAKKAEILRRTQQETLALTVPVDDDLRESEGE